MFNFGTFAAWLLRSKLYWLMGSGTMLIEVTGRKSGRPVRLPVNFTRENDGLWVISSRERVWWRNLKDNPRAGLWLGGQAMKARAELVMDFSLVAERLAALCERQTWMARALGIKLDENKQPDKDDLERVASQRLFIHLITE